MDYITYCVRCGNEHCKGDCEFKLTRLNWLDKGTSVTGESTQALQDMVQAEVEKQMSALVAKWLIAQAKDNGNETTD